MTSNDGDYDSATIAGTSVAISEDEAPEPTFTLSGSFDSDVTEADVVASGLSLTFTGVPRATFDAAVGTGGAEDDAIISAIVAANSSAVHANGFAAQMAVGAVAAAVSVTRVSGVELRVDFPLMSDYAIWSNADVLHVVLAGEALSTPAGAIDIAMYVDIQDRAHVLGNGSDDGARGCRGLGRNHAARYQRSLCR